MNREKADKEIRLQVYLAHSGVASRRKSEELIAQGRVKVNGETVLTPGTKVSENDNVQFDGHRVRPEQQSRYIALHKPPQYLCSNYDEQGRPLAVDLLRKTYKERLYNVGRLDFLSEGLIFFTNDGNFAAKVSHPSSEIEKEYRIETYDPIPEDILKESMRGVRIEGVLYRIKQYKSIDKNTVTLILIEGKNREIRKLLAHFSIRLKRLIRMRIGPVKLGTLPSGEHRLLNKWEIDWFMKGRKHDSGN